MVLYLKSKHFICFCASSGVLFISSYQTQERTHSYSSIGSQLWPLQIIKPLNQPFFTKANCSYETWSLLYYSTQWNLKQQFQTAAEKQWKPLNCIFLICKCALNFTYRLKTSLSLLWWEGLLWGWSGENILHRCNYNKEEAAFKQCFF